VYGDPDRLQQVVLNLLTNAIKFTDADGVIDVRLARDGTHLEIAVADTGQGIAPDVLPCVFDRFRQGDSSSTRTQGGLGIGLALVKNLAELHGGTATAESAGVGRGATFRVRLPLPDPAVPSTSEKREDA
jgi:signal transduction histidine kinase